MSWFTKIYWGIKIWKAPKLLKKIINHAGRIIASSLLQIGVDNMESIKREIRKVDNEKIPGTEKFKLVADYAKTLLPGMPKDILNTVIQETFTTLKDKEIV